MTIYQVEWSHELMTIYDKEVVAALDSADSNTCIAKNRTGLGWVLDLNRGHRMNISDKEWLCSDVMDAHPVSFRTG